MATPSPAQGPLGKNPFAVSPKTPGPLGYNDAASPGWNYGYLKRYVIGNAGPKGRLDIDPLAYVKYTDSIDQTLALLDQVQTFNGVMIGTSWEQGLSDLPKLTKDEITPRNRQERRKVAASGPLAPRGREMQLKSTPVSDGIASLFQSLTGIVNRNRAARDAADALRAKQTEIRRSVPKVGGTLVRFDFMIKDGTDIRFNDLVIVGTGLDFQSVKDAPHQDELLPLPNDYFEDGFWQRPLGETLFGNRNTNRWAWKSFYLWVTPPCINVPSTQVQ